MSSNILLLEDDQLLSETLCELFEDEGYKLLHVTNGQAALDATYLQKFDLYVFDINVPLLDGMTLLKDLRASNDATPTLFLTSHKDKEMLKNGFKNGADDYITKPFDPEELLLRIEALLRRTLKKSDECIGTLCHDAEHKSIRYEGVELELSVKEYQLLVLLMKHANNTVPKELIMDELWSRGEGGSDGAIRVYITRLKQLLHDIEIQNIRGVGYKLVS